MGWNAGNTDQGQYSIAIGNSAGFTGQGDYSVAIGYNAGIDQQNDNSIIINATSNSLNCGTTGTFINPIRNDSDDGIAGSTGCYALNYNPATSEIYTSNTITDVIDNGMTGYFPDISYGNPIRGRWPCYNKTDDEGCNPITYSFSRIGNIVYYSFNFDSLIVPGSTGNGFTGGYYVSHGLGGCAMFMTNLTILSSRPDLLNFVGGTNFRNPYPDVGPTGCIALGTVQSRTVGTSNTLTSVFYLSNTGQFVMCIGNNLGAAGGVNSYYIGDTTEYNPNLAICPYYSGSANWYEGVCDFSGFYFVK